MKTTNILANIADWFGEVFERLSPAMFRMLSTVLPYITPIPVAWLTAHSTATFLHFTPTISGIFVVMLEGIGLWATTELVDAFVEAIRSRNTKAWGVVVFLTGVVLAYIALLISLNVTLEKAVGNVSNTYAFILTLICFLPFIAGCLNGYRKVKMETKTNLQVAKEKQDELDEKIRQERNDLKLKKAAIKAGYNPFAPVVALQQTANAPKIQGKKSDWRELTKEEKKAVQNTNINDLLAMYEISESTGWRWKKWSKGGDY